MKAGKKETKGKVTVEQIREEDGRTKEAEHPSDDGKPKNQQRKPPEQEERPKLSLSLHQSKKKEFQVSS